MNLSDAQTLCGMLMEDGYHCWIVEGYYIQMLKDGVLYDIKISNRQPNEK